MADSEGTEEGERRERPSGERSGTFGITAEGGRDIVNCWQSR
jgi:hypothetical protein